MIVQQSSITLLTLTLFILLFSGLLVFIWGRKIPGRGTWLIWLGLLGLAAGTLLDTGLLYKEEFHIRSWISGWVGLKTEVGAITVGVLQDPFSVAMCLFTVVVAGVLLLHRGFLSREPYPERVEAAIAVSTAGVALSWIAQTPWVSFSGLILTVLGGFMALGSRWHSEDDAQIAIRFIRERASGFLLAFFGACILASSRPALMINRAEVWSTDATGLPSTWVGAGLLLVGLFIQMQSFPLARRAPKGSSIFLPLRILLKQVFPAWAAFSLLLHLQAFLSEAGLFPVFGWVALGSSLLAVVTGLFQKDWRLGLCNWLSAGFSLSVAVLAFSGKYAGLALLMGVSLGALALGSAGSMLDGAGGAPAKKDLEESQATRRVWLKIAAFLGSAAGTGVIGFVSADGGLRWITGAVKLSTLPWALADGLAFFCFVLLGWKTLWRVVRKKGLAPEATWAVVFLPYVWILLSLAVLWTGTLTGHALSGIPDRIGDSAFDFFFVGSQVSALDSGDDLSGPGLYWGALWIAFLAAYWSAGRKEDRWLALSQWMPKTSRFFADGYGVDFVFDRAKRGLIWFGRRTEALVDTKIWMDWIPRGIFYGTHAVSGGLNEFNTKISSALRETLRRCVEVPAKVLQLIQTGDIRWYLFFGVSSGFALLIHFLNE